MESVFQTRNRFASQSQHLCISGGKHSPLVKSLMLLMVVFVKKKIMLLFFLVLRKEQVA
jgi:hypothetical protein